MSAAQAVGQDGPLALVCGGGTLPLAVAESVSKRGRAIVLFALRGHADPALVARYPHHWLRLGQLGAFTRLARLAGCRDVVFIGSLVRPVLWNLAPDFKALMLLPRIMAAYRGGDNHLLSGVSRIVEDQGFRLLGAHEVAPEILVPEGALGRINVSEQHRQDIAFGFDYLHATGALRATGRIGAPAGIGVLVKAPKPRQDRRFDLPSIGPNTVAGVARAKLAGIAVVGGTTVIAEPERLVSEADRAGIFVVGVPAGTER
jgi:UDP-2,3-diacylglucosamine hydrolase